MAQRTQNPSLPLEILELIFRECEEANPDDYANLRLVCKAIDDIVGPQVLSLVSVRFLGQDVERIEEKLSHIASGLAPHTLWTKTLWIRSLVLVSNEHHPKAPENIGYEDLLECQSRWLVPVIQALRNVEEADINIDTDEPCGEVISTLSQLPHLKNLTLAFFNVSENAQSRVPLGRFSNLVALKIHYMTSIRPFIVEGIQEMIKQSPCLEELDVDFGDPREASLFLETLLPIQDPQPRSPLKKLALCISNVFLSTPCMPFLRSLTHLHVSDYFSHSASFWKDMDDAGIHVQSLQVTKLAQPITRYILSYTGLQELTLGLSLGKSDNDGLVDDFFVSIIPKHKHTLRILAFSDVLFGPWCITETRLEQICLCKKLERLDVLYYYPFPEEKVIYPIIPLDHMFSTISQNLPRLDELRLEVTRTFQSNFRSRESMNQYFAAVGKHFAFTVNRTTFSVLSLPTGRVPPPRFSVFAVNTDFRPAEIPQMPGNYRFRIVDPTVYKLGKEELEGTMEVNDCSGTEEPDVDQTSYYMSLEPRWPG